MIIVSRLFVLALAFYYTNAQWKGTVGYNRQGRHWELRGGARYDINRGRTRGSFGGHGFVTSNGKKGWGVSAGVRRTFGRGRGSYGVQGFKNSNGNYGVRATFKYKFGRKRRSVSDDLQLNKICSECVKIKTITSLEKLIEYTKLHQIQVAMLARFKRFFQFGNETVLNFKIKSILENVLPNFNTSEAKVLNIYENNTSCALICLKDFIRENYIVTGALLNGSLIIHDRILLLHSNEEQTPPSVAEEDEDEDEDTKPTEVSDKDDDNEDEDENIDKEDEDDSTETDKDDSKTTEKNSEANGEKGDGSNDDIEEEKEKEMGDEDSDDDEDEDVKEKKDTSSKGDYKNSKGWEERNETKNMFVKLRVYDSNANYDDLDERKNEGKETEIVQDYDYDKTLSTEPNTDNSQEKSEVSEKAYKAKAILKEP